MKITELRDTSQLSGDEIQHYWEEAYTSFETPEEEISKFIKRLERLGQAKWRRDAQIVDIFSGRCNGIRALERLGFTNLEGVDISPNLLSHYDGAARLYTADCRELPFPNESRDIIIVQGGLHHLPELPEDLDKTLREVRRVLRPDGRFVLVEPWLTPFLQLIHFLSERKAVRSVSKKFDAFATMTHYERDTYFRWLGKSEVILDVLKRHFEELHFRKTFGKLFFVGKKRA